MIGFHTVVTSKGTAEDAAVKANLSDKKLLPVSLRDRDLEVKQQKIVTNKAQTEIYITERSSVFRKNQTLIFNLTPEQKTLFESERQGQFHYIVVGIAGSGKTILIQMKSLEIIKRLEKENSRNENVIVFVPQAMLHPVLVLVIITAFSNRNSTQDRS